MEFKELQLGAEPLWHVPQDPHCIPSKPKSNRNGWQTSGSPYGAPELLNRDVTGPSTLFSRFGTPRASDQCISGLLRMHRRCRRTSGMSSNYRALHQKRELIG